jgi:hypothetical protein
MDDEVRKSFRNVEAKADIIDSKLNAERTSSFMDMGICADCVYCSGYERELGDAFYKCDYHDKTFNFSKPKIVRCSMWKKKHQISLSEMYGMAYMIEPGKKTIKGFGV